MTTATRQMALVTLRSPLPPRYLKMYRSLSKVFRTTLLTGTLSPKAHLRMDFGSFFAYSALAAKVSLSMKPALIDVNALVCARLRPMKHFVVDFRTPLSYELKWLGHGFLSSFAYIVEKALKDMDLMIAVNDLMAKYCTELGAKSVLVMPNYPAKAFQPSVDADKWKIMQGLPLSNDVVLFSGGARVREIYGLDMLLESWKVVQDFRDSATLVILGNDSIDYIKGLVKSVGLKRVVLPGRVGMGDVANWINCAKVCVAPRTPGFSDAFYNDQDSNKIAEYAAFKKPIVASGYAASEQYLRVCQDPAAFAEGIMKGLEGNIRPSMCHYWEENEPRLLQALENFWFE